VALERSNNAAVTDEGMIETERWQRPLVATLEILNAERRRRHAGVPCDPEIVVQLIDTLVKRVRQPFDCEFFHCDIRCRPIVVARQQIDVYRRMECAKYTERRCKIVLDKPALRLQCIFTPHRVWQKISRDNDRMRLTPRCKLEQRTIIGNVPVEIGSTGNTHMLRSRK
jgi:hypothetical protein